jgi:hypothetical protein
MPMSPTALPAKYQAKLRCLKAAEMASRFEILAIELIVLK